MNQEYNQEYKHKCTNACAVSTLSIVACLCFTSHLPHFFISDFLTLVSCLRFLIPCRLFHTTSFTSYLHITILTSFLFSHQYSRRVFHSGSIFCLAELLRLSVSLPFCTITLSSFIYLTPLPPPPFLSLTTLLHLSHIIIIPCSVVRFTYTSFSNTIASIYRSHVHHKQHSFLPSSVCLTQHPLLPPSVSLTPFLCLSVLYHNAHLLLHHASW